MYQPSREQARRFFFDTWRQYRDGAPLQPLQRMALEVMLLHPEYHAMLDQPDTYVDRDYTPESGAMNPFLHLSLHLAVDEQLSVDRPAGVRAALQRLALGEGDRHRALHALLECLGETLWQAQRLEGTPDAQAYLECLERRGGHR
ncbi:MAG: DUF1841 family protein [Burkholderiales bacterium]|nr:DUF1841 family protein [Burkholderiales bacterium]